MSGYKVEQQRLSHRGRSFHFVSYEGTPANLTKQVPATEPTWFLMSGGKRWAVMPQREGQDPADRDRLFAAWLDANVFAGA
jgi:hypothetical protein